MNSNNEINILKLGGSLLTDKNKPYSFRKDVIENAVQQIVRSGKKLVLIHGGGSFGHPLAKKYQISKGLDASVENQVLGLTMTHEAMIELNSRLIKMFQEKRFPAISFQPSLLFLKDGENFLTQSIDPIQIALDLGILPILYGDIVLDKKGSFSIISGDRIIVLLCKHLTKYRVSKVIFSIEEDGIFIKEDKTNESNVKLALELNHGDLENICLADLDQKIDVTGGIKGKINAIKEICQLNIPVQIVNGLKEDFIFKALMCQNLRCTNINIAPERTDFEGISNRKLDHLKISVEREVQHSKNYLDDIKLIHHSIPEINLDEIDLSVIFFNKKVSAPICIAAITGGHPISKEINEILAKAAEAENIIMSVGSQRIGLENPSTRDSFKIVREVAPNIPIIGNIGLGQVCDPNFDIKDLNECVEMIHADAMAIHLNALHELVQNKGNTSYKNFRTKFKNLVDNAQIPIIAKEVGTGINQELALTLDKLGVSGFDVGGAGGTSFAAIESFRKNNNNEKYTRNLSDIYRDWGIPTPISVINIRKVSDKLIIATGGLRTGVDIAKCIVLGADIGGFAHKFLASAWKDRVTKTISNTVKEIKTLKNELLSTMWLMNVSDVSELKSNSNKKIILGELNQWINQ